jgi:hypothetical protein
VEKGLVDIDVRTLWRGTVRGMGGVGAGPDSDRLTGSGRGRR